MKPILHHFTWLVSRLRWGLLVYLGSWLIAGCGVWLVPPDSMFSVPLTLLQRLLPFVGARLMASAVWQDRVLGSNAFWRTRPLRWKSLWASQWLFLVLLAVPPILSWWVNGLLLGNHASHWWRGLPELGSSLGLLLVGASLGTFLVGGNSIVLAVVLAVACFVGGNLLLLKFEWLGWSLNGTEFQLGLILPCGVGLVVWAYGLRRGKLLGRAVALGLAFLLGPMLAALLWFHPMPPSPPTHAMTFSVAGDYASGSQPLKIDFHAVPSGLYPAGWKPSLKLTSTNPNDRAFSASFDRYQQSEALERERQIPPDQLKAGFAPTTQWYLDTPVLDTKPWLIQFPVAGTCIASGEINGYFTKFQRLASVPLVTGAAAADQGTRLVITEITINDRALELELRVYRAPLPNEAQRSQRQNPSLGNPADHLLVPVAYFPALQLAVVHSPMNWAAEPQGIQVRSGKINWPLVLPQSAQLRGLEFNAETLRDAQLVLFELEQAGEFHAVSDEKPIVVKPAAALDLKLQKLRIQQFSMPEGALQQLESELLAAGEPALRALMARPWNSATVSLAGRLLEQASAPVILEAMAVDAQWQELVWRGSAAAKIAPAMADQLRAATRKLSLVELAMALTKVVPADYPAVRQQVERQGPSVWKQTDLAPLALWRGLRALPGFDWQTLARQQWEILHCEDIASDGLRLMATLAGSATALNSLAATGALDEPPGTMSLEVDALAEMIEGLPPAGPERQTWLRQQWGAFVWDETAGKYRVK